MPKLVTLLNGPNLNLLGIREPEIYGRGTYADLCELIQKYCGEKGVEATFYQSNHEGGIVDEIQAAYGKMDGIVLNPGGYTHTSVAIRDALAAVALSFIEIHLSNPHRREPFRHTSYFSDLALGVVCGFGADSYLYALDAALARLTPTPDT